MKKKLISLLFIGCIVIITPTSIYAKTKNTFSTDNDYDALQNIFLSLSVDSTVEDLESLITQYDLPYTSEEYNNGETITYVIAYSEDSARQHHAESGDNLDVSFCLKDNTLMHADYSTTSNTGSVLLYNYGTWFSFREDEPSDYTGYYFINQLSEEKGITIKYDNGNEADTKYFPYDTAEETLKKLLAS